MKLIAIFQFVTLALLCSSCAHLPGNEQLQEPCTRMLSGDEAKSMLLSGKVTFVFEPHEPPTVFWLRNKKAVCTEWQGWESFLQDNDLMDKVTYGIE